MIEANPPCDHVTSHPTLRVAVSPFRSVQPICSQTWQQWEGRSDGWRNRQAWGGWTVEEQEKEAAGLLSDKKAHTTEVREIKLESLHIFFFFWPPLHLMCGCGLWATQGPVVKLFARLNGSFPFEGIACGPCLILISLLLLSLVRLCSFLPILPQWSLWCRATRLHFATQVVMLWLSDLWGKWSREWQGAGRDRFPFLRNSNFLEFNCNDC